MVDPGKHVQQGRFAAARFAHQRHKLAIPDLQIDASQRGEAAGRVDVGLDHVLEKDRRLGRVMP